LEHPVGEILADRETGDGLPRVRRPHPVRRQADDHDGIDLPVDRRAAQLHHAVGSREAGGELREHDERGRSDESCLERVRHVVQPEREHVTKSG